MWTILKTGLLASLACAGAACAHPAPAYAAGGWHLVAARCPDLVEDRFDRRVTWSRADLREDRRDARRVRCPASAYIWTGPARYAARYPAPADAVVYVGPNYTYAVRDRRGRDLNVRIVVDAR